jgi:hypothetical protein
MADLISVYTAFGLHISAFSSDILAIIEVSMKEQSGATQSAAVVWELHCFIAASSRSLDRSFGMHIWDGMTGLTGLTGSGLVPS